MSNSVKWSMPWVLLLLMVVCGPAHAQWQVTDERTQSKLDELRNDANEKLDKLREQQNVGGRGSNSGQDPEQPSLLLSADQLSQAMTSEQYGEEIRCPQPKSNNDGPMQQWTICKEIVRTELAKYQYALAMREVVVKRQQRLHEIERTRANLDNGDAGRLQSNNNELLALQARLAVDRQQYKTYMDAYDARVSYLHALRQGLGNKIVNGSLGDSPVGIIVGSTALAALKLALDSQRSDKNGIFNDH